MTNKNRYYKRSRITERTFRRLIRCFTLDLTATNCSALTGISTRSVNDIFLKIRTQLVPECQRHSPLAGEIETDESYFGPKRIRGKRGRGAGSKTIVFGIFQRNGWVYTEIVPDIRKASLQKVIRGHVKLETVIHSDGWRGYQGLVDMGYSKHYRVHHGVNEFARGNAHINGIESFWAFAKLRLIKFKGISKRTFFLHLKETEFRFNHRNDDLYRLLMFILRNNPI